jgi:hypothetical protein
LGSGVVPGGVGDNSVQSVVGCDVQQGDESLRCIAVTSGRWGKAVTDLDTSVVRLTLEADSTDGLPVGGPRDSVVPERALIPVGGRSSEKGRDSDDVAVERKVLSPDIPGCGAPPDDAFALCCVNGMQAQPRSLKFGHGHSEAALAIPHKPIPPARNPCNTLGQASYLPRLKG